jgi:hypothetical protein
LLCKHLTAFSLEINVKEKTLSSYALPGSTLFVVRQAMYSEILLGPMSFLQLKQLVRMPFVSRSLAVDALFEPFRYLKIEGTYLFNH